MENLLLFIAISRTHFLDIPNASQPKILRFPSHEQTYRTKHYCYKIQNQ